ncbi:iron ABC transporter permease [Mycobacterium sp. SMC-4]|uniref:FecCD family ABC transporter permease n=1 Tax=Mycobacterium sp. SMC-4 TaxID=2857059 RepID=UPI0021B34DED|nr:iron chelate uptake ABC transporter family permease subunit [Mycobacterium sp. SMC-4]UXA20944.1 iron chelate uptake ABC transporter family permease subunit [Mycobacterium sp. SMC-4]
MPLVALIGIGGLALSIAAAITIGPADLSVGDVYRIIARHVWNAPSDLSLIDDAIVWQLRLPGALLAAICGAGLAVVGVVLQSMMRNPLADPFILGISSGASTGAVLVIVTGVGGFLGLSGGAFAGALAAFGFVLVLAALVGGGTARVVLAGVAATELFSAVTAFVVFSSADAQQTRGVLFWLLGSLGGASWNQVALCGAICVLSLAVCLSQADALDAFVFGRDTAASLGISVTQVRIVLLVVTALLTAVLVSAAGAIGFVGLVIPHAARIVVGPLHRRLLVVSALVGAIFLVWVDAVARTVFEPQELPVGVVTAMVGVPIFVLILARRRPLP